MSSPTVLAPKFVTSCPSDTAANWMATTFIIPTGIVCIEQDTRRVKIGDGLHTWSELAYSSDPVALDALIAQVAAMQEVNKTFTPAFSGGTHAYSTRVGSYSRISQLVWVNLHLVLSSRAANVGNIPLTISGLPYPIGNRSVIDVPCIWQQFSLVKNAMLGARLIAGTNTLKLYSYRTDVASYADLTASGALLNNSEISLSFVYEKQ